MTITLDTITLPDELLWLDEFNWSDVKSNNLYTLQGRLIIEESSILASKGRPITLISENAWLERSDLKILFGWAQETDKKMTLTMHDNEIFTVGFRHWDNPVLEIQNITQTPFRTDDVLYALSMKLVVV